MTGSFACDNERWGSSHFRLRLTNASGSSCTQTTCSEIEYKFIVQVTRLLLSNYLFTIFTTEWTQTYVYINVTRFPTQNHTQITATPAITWQNAVGRPSNDFWSLLDRLKLTARIWKRGEKKKATPSRVFIATLEAHPQNVFFERWKRGSGLTASSCVRLEAFAVNYTCNEVLSSYRLRQYGTNANVSKPFLAYVSRNWCHIVSNLITTHGPRKLNFLN